MVTTEHQKWAKKGQKNVASAEASVGESVSHSGQYLLVMYKSSH